MPNTANIHANQYQQHNYHYINIVFPFFGTGFSLQSHGGTRTHYIDQVVLNCGHPPASASAPASGVLSDSCEPAQLTPLLGFVICHMAAWRDHHMSPVETTQLCHWRINECKALAKFLWTLKFKFHIMFMCQKYYSFVFDQILYPIDLSFQLLK